MATKSNKFLESFRNLNSNVQNIWSYEFPFDFFTGHQISVDVKTKNDVRKNGQIILEKSEVTSLGEGQISMTMMLVIILLSVMSVLMLIILATWYIR